MADTHTTPAPTAPTTPAAAADTHRLVVRRVLPAPREEVFAMWTDAASVAEWMRPSERVPRSRVELDVRVGGQFTVEMIGADRSWLHTGEYLEVSPPERLIFSWISEGSAHRRSVVTVELFERGERTELVLTHEGLPTEQAAREHMEGWSEILLELERRIERVREAGSRRGSIPAALGITLRSRSCNSAPEEIMALVQRDFILRMIEAVAAAIARILRRRQSGDLAGARREVDMACTELLGPIASVASRVDSQTAANLLGDGRHIAAWARLLAEDSDILREMARDAEADANDKRVLELLLEAWLRDRELDAESSAALEQVRARLAPGVLGALDPRYRDALLALGAA